MSSKYEYKYIYTYIFKERGRGREGGREGESVCHNLKRQGMGEEAKRVGELLAIQEHEIKTKAAAQRACPSTLSFSFRFIAWLACGRDI